MIFSYVFPGEPAAVTLGCYAVDDSRPLPEVKAACSDTVVEFDREFIDASSIDFLGGATRGLVWASLQARVAGSRSRRGLGRVARAVATRLARI